MTLRVEIKPKLLKWACERSGRPFEDFLMKFPQLSDWMKGDNTPTLKQLEKFALATRVPVGFFFLTDPPIENVPIPDFRTISGRNIHRLSPDLLETIYICQQRQEWYRDFSLSMHEKPLPFVGKLKRTLDSVEAAATIRDHLGFDLKARSKLTSWIEALRQFIDLVEGAGIMVMCSGVVLNNNTRPLDPDEFRGFAMSDELAPLIFINGADTKSAQMFTMAHELAHIWLGQSAISDASIATTSTHEIERWCNQVAAEILVPMKSFTDVYNPKGNLPAELDRLARHFKVSTLVILRRIADSGAMTKKQLSDAYAAELQRIQSKSTSSGGGNFYLTLPVRVSKRFARALVASTYEGQTLHRDALRMLGFSKVETLHHLGKSLGVLR